MGISEELQPQAVATGYPFERILVPLDGSSSAESVLSTVTALCRQHASHAVLVRIVEPPLPSSASSPGRDSEHLAQLYLRQIAAALEHQGIQAKAIVRVGPVLESLLVAAAEEGTSLIAMSTHGRLTSETLPFGTIGEKLLRSSPIPILAVPPHAHAGGPKPFRTILVPVEGGDPSSGIVPTAVEFALSFGADLAILLQVVPPSFTGREEAERHVEAEEHLARLAPFFEAKRIPTVRLMEQGDPVSAILAAARDRAADVIAMNLQGAEGVLKGSPVPVLTSRPVSFEPLSQPGARTGARTAEDDSA